MQNQTTHHEGKQEERQVGRQAGRHEGRQAGRQRRQNLGKADTPSNTGKKGDNWRQGGDKTSRKWTHHPTQVTCGETMGDKRRQDLGKAGTTSNTGTRVGRQWGTRPLEGGYDPRRRHHPTQAPMRGDNGRQWGDKTSEGGHTIQHRRTCGGTMGNNGTQPETRGDGETRRETMGDNWGDNGRQVETRPRGG